ncbi:MAG: M28 family peptidase [Gemmatimonadales bacterium]|nr:M28 family peptidase [Gemmatimonadales bacterium]
MRRGSSALVGCLLLGVAGGGCAGEGASIALEAIQPSALDAHLRFLSSDLLQGRAPGTPGSETAASYIAMQFRLAGLTPGIGDTSYFQPVPLIARTAFAVLSFRAPGGAAYSPDARLESVVWSKDTAQVSSVDVELVFVGYGVVAPEYEWDDYKEVDVQGKTLLLLAGDPGGHVPGRFRGDTATYYASADYKFAEAARRGALGALLVHSPELPYGWDAIHGVRAGEQVTLDRERADSAPRYSGWLIQGAAEQVVSMAGLDFATLLESARSAKFRPIVTDMRVSASVRNEVRQLAAANVVGSVPGNDPELAREFVIITAHYDHLGVGEPVDSDSIYNGAYDNASGTALLLCLADAFARLRPGPDRSVLFLALTAEEPGLLGSRAFIQSPLVPLASIAANVNIDGVNLWGPTEDIVVLGTEYSTLRSAARHAAAEEGLRLEGDRSPEQGYLYRSDQFAFMRAGVPSVLVGHGLDFIGRMPGWGEQILAEYIRTGYHRPSDEYRADFDLRGAVQQGRAAFRLALWAANTPARPAWSGESGFVDLR